MTSDARLVGDISHEIGANEWQHPFMRRFRFRQATPLPGRWGLIACSRAQNYAHWLFDALPKVAMLRAVGVDQFLAPHETSFQRESLLAAGLDGGQVVALEVDRWWQVEELVAASLPGGSGNPSFWEVEWLRSLAGKRDGIAQDRRRLFISRDKRGPRAVVNEQELMRSLESRGFEWVQLEELAFAEKMEAFRSAEFVIGAHGAGLSNLVFARPGTRLIEIFPPRYVNVCYWALAHAARQHYAAVAGVDGPRGNLLSPGRDQIRVDVEELLRVVDQLDSSAAQFTEMPS